MVFIQAESAESLHSIILFQQDELWLDIKTVLLHRLNMLSAYQYFTKIIQEK